ncbi:MAG: 23S rRNA (adenine(2503)-C(2))-methyltransferase RlmN [Oscillospiraceae bacterium]|nr:23S rRNA (adenine(2503)-C(2))-methyltransferase RlmN [Oscillospiraceae bacterium]
MNTDELADFVIEHGQPKYRGEQIARWLGRGVVDIDEMTDLPKDFRSKIRDCCETGAPAIIDKFVSGRDGTVKYVFSFSNNCVLEGALLKYKHGNTACISSQAGCRMGCKFCASKPEDYLRNLSCGEMLGQVFAINRDIRDIGEAEKVNHVVVMGIGEPFDNYDNCLKFLKLLHDNPETGIGYRKMTVSTCGVVPGIETLADEGLQIGLSVSLHAPDDKTRGTLMPINKKYRVRQLIEACGLYAKKTGRRVTFEYALIDGVNDSEWHAAELVRKLKGMLCHVNLLPVNSIEGFGHKPPERIKIDRFEAILRGGGINATVRRVLGADIKAACGQLRKSQLESDSSVVTVESE